MLKPSMFNYTTYNDNGELLMLNTYTGRMVKASPEKTEVIQNMLKEASVDSENALAAKLKAEGLLVDQEEDEGAKLQALYINLQSHPVLTLMILPTEQCNFRCAYCPETFEKGKMSEEVQNAIVEYVKRNITYYTGLKIMWFGGEPLLEMGIIRNLSLQFKKICKAAKRSYFAHVTTNAYLLSYEVFKELLDYNVFEYQISLDGFKETHDTQRYLADGGSTYDTIIKNLTDIKNNSKSGKFRINIRTNFTKKMIPTIPKYIDWFNFTFGDDTRFCLRTFLAGNIGGDKVRDMKNELINSVKDINIFFETLINSNIQYSNLVNMKFSPGSLICEAGCKNFYVIDSNGTVRKCSCRLNEENKNKIGNMLKNGFIEKEKSNAWILPGESAKCEKCFLAPACFGHSCTRTNIYGGVPRCPDQKEQIDYYLKIFDKQGLYHEISI